MIIHIFTEKYFPQIFEPLIPWASLAPHFFSFLRGLHTDKTLEANKYTKNIK